MHLFSSFSEKLVGFVRSFVRIIETCFDDVWGSSLLESSPPNSHLKS